MSSGLTSVTSAALKDASGNLISNATIYWEPVINDGVPSSFRAGGTSMGQVSTKKVSASVSGGAFTISVYDTSITNPVNVGYRVTCIDEESGEDLLGPGYECVQPSGSVWSFDSYVPNLAPQAPFIPSLGPVGPPGAQGVPGTSTIGRVVYQKSSWANLSDFSIGGSLTASIDGNGRITLSNGSNDFASYLALNSSVVSDDQYDIEVIFSPTSMGSSDVGVFLGKLSVETLASNSVSFAMDVSTPTASNQYLAAITRFGNLSSVTILDGGCTIGNGSQIVANDLVKFIYSQRGNRITAIVNDLTSEVAAAFSLDLPTQFPMSTSLYMPNTSKAALWLTANMSITIYSIKVTSRQPFAPHLAIVGDSRSLGYSAAQFDLRYASLLDSLGPVAVYAGGGDQIQDAQAGAANVIATKPSNVLIYLGVNNLGAESEATIESQYAALVATYVAAGINVYHLTTPPSGSAALNAFIAATYPGKVINVSTVDMYSDGIHPSTLGHQQIAAEILASGLMVPATPLKQSILSSLDQYPGIGPQSLFDQVTARTLKLQAGNVGTSFNGGAPLLFSPGPVLTTPQDGALEYDGTHFYFTIGSTRHTII